MTGTNPTLTIAATGSIRTADGFVGSATIGLNPFFGNIERIINRGTIAVGQGAAMTINSNSTQNEGIISVGPQANFTLNGLTGNLNRLDAAVGAAYVALMGHDFVINDDFEVRELQLGGSWTNQANIKVTGTGSVSLNADGSSAMERWTNDGSIEVTDVGLARYISLEAVGVMHHGARHANKHFGKTKVHVVERLINDIMRSETYQGKKSKAYRAVEQAFERVDVVAMPTSPIPPFRLGEKTDDPLTMYLSDIFTISANLAGLPGISLPCGFTQAGLPIGLQLLGKPLGEEILLQVAFAYEQATDWHKRKPPV